VVTEINRRGTGRKLIGRTLRNRRFDRREHRLRGVTNVEADLGGLQSGCASLHSDGGHAVLHVTDALGQQVVIPEKKLLETILNSRAAARDVCAVIHVDGVFTICFAPLQGAKRTGGKHGGRLGKQEDHEFGIPGFKSALQIFDRMESAEIQRCGGAVQRQDRTNNITGLDLVSVQPLRGNIFCSKEGPGAKA
jgi:hypothetical protein